jgi:hypothetical protein
MLWPLNKVVLAGYVTWGAKKLPSILLVYVNTRPAISAFDELGLLPSLGNSGNVKSNLVNNLMQFVIDED